MSNAMPSSPNPSVRRLATVEALGHDALTVTQLLSGTLFMARSLLDWFRGPEGGHRLVEELKTQPLVLRQQDLALEIARDLKLEEVPSGAMLIEQGASDNDLYLILRGEFSVSIDGRTVARLGAGQHVGEMAALMDARRSATVTALADAVVARIGKGEFFALAGRFPELWQRVAAQLAIRLNNNARLPPARSANG